MYTYKYTIPMDPLWVYTFGPPKPWKMKVLGPQYMGHNP